MAEEPKNIRLNKAAKEFNVGIQSLVEFLAKKGHQIEMNPNTRITPEQYELLSQAFATEREVKENADRIEITSNGNVVISAENDVAPAHDEAEDELMVKNFSAPVAAEPEPKPAPEPEPEPEPQAAAPAEPEPTKEEKLLTEIRDLLKK